MIELSPYLRFLLILPFSLLFSMEIGNPAQPYLQKQGVISDKPSEWSLRLAYLDDYIYRMRFKDEFPSLDPTAPPVYAKLATNVGQITLNFLNRLDFYGILGTSQIQVGNEVYAKRELAWGIGGKLLFAKVAKISFGIDLKYFTTSQKPLYIFSGFPPDEDGVPIQAGGYPYRVLNDYHLCYWETQGALGASYRTKLISPYLHITYIVSKIDPQPAVALLQMPGDPPDSVNAISKSVVCERRWGMAVGATLLGSPKATITVESRFINQNAIDVNGEFRF